MTALIERERMDGLGQQGQHPVEAPPRVHPSVEQQNRNPIRIALLNVGQLESIAHHCETRHALILSPSPAARTSRVRHPMNGSVSERPDALLAWATRRRGDWADSHACKSQTERARARRRAVRLLIVTGERLGWLRGGDRVPGKQQRAGRVSPIACTAQLHG